MNETTTMIFFFLEKLIKKDSFPNWVVWWGFLKNIFPLGKEASESDLKLLFWMLDAKSLKDDGEISFREASGYQTVERA